VIFRQELQYGVPFLREGGAEKPAETAAYGA